MWYVIDSGRDYLIGGRCVRFVVAESAVMYVERCTIREYAELVAEHHNIRVLWED